MKARSGGAESARLVSSYLGVLRYLLFVLAAGLSLYWISYSSGWIQIAVFLAFSISLTLACMRSLVHPLAVFVPFFALYSVSFPIMAAAGVYVQDDAVSDVLVLHFLALVAFAVGTGFQPGAPLSSAQIKPVESLKLAAGLSTVVFAVISGAVLLAILAGGYASKQEIVAARGSSVLLRLDSAFVLLNLAAGVWIVERWLRGESARGLVIVAVAAFALIFLITGERDVLLRFLILVVLAAWELTRRLRLVTVIFTGMGLFLLLPLLQAMKGLLIGGGAVAVDYSILSLFSGEFRSMGQNTYTILMREIPTMWGESIGWDLRRFASSRLLGTEATSTGEWFNTEVLPQVTTGRGFSLVAQGYLNFGILGVAGLYLVLGFMTRLLHSLRRVNALSYSGYLLYLPVLVYVQRADVANLLSLTTKTVAIPLLILGVVAVVIRTSPFYVRARSTSGVVPL